jgi:hypothetical protein
MYEVRGSHGEDVDVSFEGYDAIWTCTEVQVLIGM